MLSENQLPSPDSYPMTATDRGVNSGAIIVEQTNNVNPLAYIDNVNEGGQPEDHNTAAFDGASDERLGGVGSEDLPG